MAIKVGINGFGRIGRMVFRAAVQNCPGFEIAGINDLLEPDYLAYMLQSDSVHGRFRGTVAVQGNMPIVNASLADGGDTLAAIARYGIADDTDCISTVGGAFLEVLEGKPPSAFEILARRAAQGIAA